MQREADLIDVWFDSGSMPYAQWHYPFEPLPGSEKSPITPEGELALHRIPDQNPQKDLRKIPIRNVPVSPDKPPWGVWGLRI